VFGTYPLHRRPREQRVVNLHRLYEEWLSGGRALLLPFRLAWRSLLALGTGMRWVVQAVREIRVPQLRRDPRDAADADFATAVRKIDRMRLPAVEAAMALRARADPEYLGVALPGVPAPPGGGGEVGEDLRFVAALPEARHALEEARDQAQADMRRLARLLEEGLLDRVARRLGIDAGSLGPRHRRAAAVAYRADLLGVRTLLSAADVVRESFAAAGRRQPRGLRFRLRPGLARAFRRWRAANPFPDRAACAAAWRVAAEDWNGAGRALGRWAEDGEAAAREEGERRLADLLRHPGRLEEQLHTLRTVQTLSIIDVLNYRTHVWRLGRYAEDGEDAGPHLTLGEA
jgi:hypothetical protein